MSRPGTPTEAGAPPLAASSDGRASSTRGRSWVVEVDEVSTPLAPPGGPEAHDPPVELVGPLEGRRTPELRLRVSVACLRVERSAAGRARSRFGAPVQARRRVAERRAFRRAAKTNEVKSCGRQQAEGNTSASRETTIAGLQWHAAGRALMWHDANRNRRAVDDASGCHAPACAAPLCWTHASEPSFGIH
eukprot:CAMPEP_0206154956 /NCGR_PEP_ID=MMETSP1474-20131121/1798_1 /ASSEMBLY_ACC=CAM_ASM_001110 /TAXON_ID=97495 /ORGANISM="Imantonia sp., Strain RCC918" /LENGTH=189 /DNA_ID=CAMNT_0053553445 /DNA_START=253 /DNA_END=823 /DNA_ORIENTATION=+